jgi:hypothetical protein
MMNGLHFGARGVRLNVQSDRQESVSKMWRKAMSACVSLVVLLLVSQLAVSAQSELGSRDNPVPMHQAFTVGDWSINVVSVNRDAFTFIQSSDAYAEAPPHGFVDVLVSMELVYVGKDAGNAYLLNFIAIGKSNVDYDFQSECNGSYPNDPITTSDVLPGGKVNINYCWQVTDDDVDTLVMYVMPFVEQSRFFFALDHPENATPEATP